MSQPKFKIKSRKNMANPWTDIPMYMRIAGSTKLLNNSRIIEYGNGYISVVPIDESIKWTEKDYKEYMKSLGRYEYMVWKGR